MSESRKTHISKASIRLRDRAFFEGFAWSIPVAFSPAIAAYRFEQGDVLYREKEAYGPLEKRIPKGLRAIQVLLPARSGRATPVESEGSRRLASWQSEVTIDCIDLALGRSESRVISQGKLLTTLWRGDESWLDPEREEPPLPRTAKDLQRRLEETIPAFEVRQRAKRGCRFIFVVDLASDASRIKARNVEEALRGIGDIEVIELALRDSGVEDAMDYLPTVVVRALVMPKRTTDEVLPTLRACLYSGGSETLEPSTEPASGGATSDRFSIGRHGLLQDLGVDSSATR